MEELQAASAVGQGKLYRAYDELLQARGVPSAQVLLTFFDMSARSHYLNARHTLQKLLDWRVVPVINENDTTTTDEISFGDNDFLAAQVAILLGADRLVLLTDTGGLHSADPRARPRGAPDRRRARLRASSSTTTSGSPRSPLGSGGMRSKVVAAEMATAAGIPVTIASGVDRSRGARRSPASPPAPASTPRRAGCRASSCGCSTPSPRTGALIGRRRGRAGAARARHEPAAGGGRGGGGRLRGRRRGGGPLRTAGAVGKGIVNYSAERAASGSRA